MYLLSPVYVSWMYRNKERVWVATVVVPIISIVMAFLVFYGDNACSSEAIKEEKLHSDMSYKSPAYEPDFFRPFVSEILKIHFD